MEREMFSALIITVLFLIIFLIAELWRYNKHPKAEITRKFVHFASGLIALSFSYIFNSQWTVLTLCILFTALIFITKRYGWLQSIHAVERESEGCIYVPVAIYLTFLTAKILHEPVFYLISIMVLSISDTLAALIGKSYGFKYYQVQTEKRSLEGSIIFFISTFLIVHLALLLITNTGKIECILLALMIAILVTSFEAISLAGADNLFIPLGTMFILAKNIDKSSLDLAFQIFLIILIFSFIFLITYRSKKFGLSGIIGIALAGYAAWVLINPIWFLPILIGTILVSYTDLFIKISGSYDNLHRIQPVFYILIVPVIWMFFTNLLGNRISTNVDFKWLLLTPFLYSVMAQLSIMWLWKIKNNINEDSIKLRGYLYQPNSIFRAIVLTIIFGSIYCLIYALISPAVSLITCIAGILLTDTIYCLIANKKMDKWEQIDYLRMGMGVVCGVSLLVFFSNLVYYNL